MKLSLEDKNWKEFRIGDTFEVSKGIYLPKKKIKVGDTPYITAKSENNGVIQFIANKPLFDGNAITIGKVDLSAYYQEEPFYCSHDVSVITHSSFNKYNGQFIARMIKRQGFKYSYGRQAQLNVVKSEKVYLPTNSQGNPDYEFMEAYMRQKEQEKLDKYKYFVSKRLAELQDYKEVKPLEDKEWGEFFIQDVATIESGRDIYAKERISGNTPYVSSTSNNNGIGYFVSNDNKTKEAGCLSVNRNGSVGYSFYHSYEALFSNDCRKLRLNQPSKHVGIFISQQITRQREKYGYGYKMGTARLKRQKIMLPMDNQNQPDYKYMENYMKKIEFQEIKKYLDKKNLS